MLIHPQFNPVAIAVALIASVLFATGTPYRTYFEGAQFVHFLLGPATVALAVPLYSQYARLKSMALPLTRRESSRLRLRHMRPRWSSIRSTPIPSICWVWPGCRLAILRQAQV